jgi:phosphoribosylanthranilate isomerase
VARRTLVKICGITRLADARMAIAAGADWIGLIVLGESPRRIDADAAREITSAVDGAVTVAVMVAPTPDQALDLARRAGVARVQLHRVDPLGWPQDFPLPVSFAISVDVDGSLTAPLPAAEHLVLLDTAHPTRAGGTGTTFPWDSARVVAGAREVFLAGGLGPDNVAAAIAAVHPYGVDASSRLESAPGTKDERRVRAFVAAVRAADARHASDADEPPS